MTYRIMGMYRGKTEEIDSVEDDKKEANRLRGEYALAFGFDWRVWVSTGELEGLNRDV